MNKIGLTLKSRLDDPRSRRNGAGEARKFPAVAGNSQKPSHPPRLRGGVFPSPPFWQLSPRVILADHHTYRDLKEVNALKAVADREVIRLLNKDLSSSKQ